MNSNEAEVKVSKFCKPLAHLPVRDLRQTLDYYREFLGFSDEWTHGAKDGGIQRDALRLLFGEDPNFTDAINNEEHRLPIMWFVENIEGIYDEFQSRDIEIVDHLQAQPFGLKEFAFIDINGYHIRIAESIVQRQS